MKKKIKALILALTIAGTIPTILPTTAKAIDCSYSNTITHQTCLKDFFNRYPQFKNCTIITAKKTIPIKTITLKTTPTKTITTKTSTPKATSPTKPVQKSQQAPISTPATSTNTEASEVIRLVNVERSKNGLAPLKANTELSRVATLKAQDMIDKKYFSHTSPTYGSPFNMMKKFGINYITAGENIAYGQKTPAEVMKGWMNSAGHRANILNSNFTEIGVGMAKDKNGTPYWVQMFITPSK